MTELPILIEEKMYQWQAEFMGISSSGEGVDVIPSTTSPSRERGDYGRTGKEADH